MTNRAGASSAIAAQERDPITCAQYEPFSGSRRCTHYLPSGACALPLRLTCIEWLKLARRRANSSPRAGAPQLERSEDASSYPPAAADRAPVQQDFFGAPPPLDRSKPGPSTTAAVAPPPRSELPAPRPVDPEPSERALSDEDVASFKALRAEVCITSPTVGEVWLVGEYSGGDRREISAEDMAKLSAICAAFPGAQVVSFRTAGERDGPDPSSRAE